MKPTDDVRVKGYIPLMKPKRLKQEIPISSKAIEAVVSGRESIEKILLKEDRRLLVIVGPCSIHDKKSALEYAAKLNLSPTGNARTSTYHTPPIIRMRNTYLEKGDFSFEELIEDIRHGIYVEKFMGGQASLIGMFQFAGQVGWLIEKGQLTTPIRDVTISGSTLETLKTLDAIGRDFGTDIGICGKGQQISVGSGGPPIRVPKLSVGGE